MKESDQSVSNPKSGKKKKKQFVLLRGAGFLEFQLNVISKIVILSFGELLETKLIIRGNENLKYLKNETKIYFRV